MLRFHVADTLTGALLGQLHPSEWMISDPVTGSATGSVTLRIPQDAAGTARLADLVRPRRRQLIVEDTDAPPTANRFLFGGPIPHRASYNRTAGTITVPVVDWRGWFYAAVLRPDTDWTATSGHVGDYIVKDTEQADSMAWLMEAALNTVGAPHMVVDDPPVTGVLRDVTVRALGRYIGEELDAIRDRNDDGTCDWYTYVTYDEAARTFLAHVAVAWPQRSSRSDPITLGVKGSEELQVRAGHGSPVSDYTWPEGVDQPTRVFALGEGNPPAQVWAGDQLPDVGDLDDTGAPSDEAELCWEQLAGPFTGVVRKAGAFEHASSIVSATAELSGQATFTVPATRVGLAEIVAGDRARLLVSDGWLDVELDAVRIIQRDLSGSQGAPVQQVLTLDLADPVAVGSADPGVDGVTDGS
ncbi:MAG TPA: hypothetical protein VFV01_47780 [Spirillospora sp.]|nr:hypothetical protein [Spirillospora sp.]